MIKEPGIYRPRSPQNTPFYQCIADHLKEFERVLTSGMKGNMDSGSRLLLKILKHLDLWQPQAHSPPVNEETKIIEEAMYNYSFFDYLPA